MVSASYRRLAMLSAMIVANVLSTTAEAQKAKIDFKRRPGVVWFIASVTNDDEGVPSIDMGDAHGITEGEPVALFRPVEDFFEPVGSVRIRVTHSTWSIPETTQTIVPRIGDRVVFVRTLSQLGDANEFRERFLRQQLVKTGIRNHYSTLQLQDQVDALAQILVRQPHWQRDQKPISGHFRSASVTVENLRQMKPLLTQVLRFQDFSTLRIPVANVAGAEWASVLETLTPEIDAAFPDSHLKVNGEPIQQDPPEVAARKAEEAAAQAQQDVALKARIDRTRKIVDQLLFSRPREQRRVIVMLCTAVDKFQPSQERPWFSSEMRATQFPQLTEDQQLLEDFGAVMRRLREEPK
ncbi:MAG: hypothetical protein ACK58L_23115 [Planctomycetota bacterium]